MHDGDLEIYSAPLGDFWGGKRGQKGPGDQLAEGRMVQRGCGEGAKGVQRGCQGGARGCKRVQKAVQKGAQKRHKRGTKRDAKRVPSKKEVQRGY